MDNDEDLFIFSDDAGEQEILNNVYRSGFCESGMDICLVFVEAIKKSEAIGMDPENVIHAIKGFASDRVSYYGFLLEDIRKEFDDEL